MFRALLGGIQEIPLKSWTGLQVVRWRRKPRWLPMAQSRYNKVPERKPVDPEEKDEMMRLFNIYRTQYKSVRKFLMAEVEAKKAQTTVLTMTPEEEEADMKRSMEINEEWNRKAAEVRNQRLEEQMELRKKDILERLEAKQLREEERRRWAEERVKQEIERSKTFIARENLEAAIEHALANPTDFNFAIDLKLNIYRGRTATTPSGSLSRDSAEDRVTN
ncbi:probable 28S ribosomal protein S26, mitochondrial [Phlebotomus papatasi]|uniref:Small ribosomal subunit protein mS26 n=1 Tax=Phlebotomus papatasi TaxID=29031 RepID=A0A1B0GPU5_PHLPP|nr:probable 28S ribosomal protein S26, mitochondrial [Phlebotomus papatasi]